jgi:protein-disulfide isomerase
MKLKWMHFVDGATVLAAVSAFGFFLTSLAQNPTPGPWGDETPIQIPNWEEYVKDGHWIGPDDASVVILEFGDYECPSCRSFEKTLNSVRDRYPNEVAVVFRHWPLSNHRYALPAARAGECAAEQDKFEEFHILLFLRDNWFGDAFRRMAVDAGIPDIKRFLACTESDGPVPQIEQDIAAANELKGVGTPMVIVEGVYYPMGLDSSQLSAIIERSRDRTLE